MNDNEDIKSKLAAVLKSARPAVLEVRPPNMCGQQAALSSLKSDPILWVLVARYLEEEFGSSDIQALSEDALRAAMRRAVVLMAMLTECPSSQKPSEQKISTPGVSVVGSLN